MPLTGEYEKSDHQSWAQDQIDQILETGTTDGLDVNGSPIVLVTYPGRRSGKLRHLPCMRVEHNGAYACVASKGGNPANPGWYTSVRDAEFVELQDGTTKGDYTVREVSGQERDEWWERSVAAYPDYADYQKNTDRVIPVFVLEPKS